MPAPRTVLITGCSSPAGIGFHAARALAAEGHRVLATVRDHAHDAALLAGREDRLEILDLDLLDTALITAVAERAAREGVDMLVNNAGYGIIGTIETVTLDQARANFETNFFGTMALVQALLPALRARNGGHIVNVSSIFVPGMSPPAIGFYIASKAALEAACQSLAIEGAASGIRVTNLQPGPVGTELERRYGERTPPGGDPRPDLTNALYAWIGDGDGPSAESPDLVAAAIFRLAADDHPPLALQTSDDAQAYVARALRDPTGGAELDAIARAFPAPPGHRQSR
jgi:NAD(P)-dependent dehydrogenase (short-subunit alcohol dehydrogenase family)